jgi:hypothetical protein
LRKPWAQHQASWHNAHFAQPEGLPFMPEDFLDSGARESRKRQAAKDKREVARMNKELSLMSADDDSKVPTWAKGVN